MKKITFLLLWFLNFHLLYAQQDTLIFKGQLSAWLHYNESNDLSTWSGARYIPQLNYLYTLPNKKNIDLEISANMYGNLASNFTDSLFSAGQINPYRLWLRYSGEQFELRAGLQKINFGSATVLRPLMWFDQIDVRDPLKLTTGVWGILGRYYFLNNTNIWVWALYGNNNARGWESIDRNKNYPEGGTRIQFPLLNSELAFSYHHQIIDTRSLVGILPAFDKIAENKFGIDLKIDWFLGTWIEAAWSVKNENLGILTNQKMMTFGLDYTFGIGNGLYIMTEHLSAINSEKISGMETSIHFTAMSASYPVGLFDNIQVILYYDWANKSLYNFINWQREFNKLSLHVMAYWNPENSTLPAQGTGGTSLFGGKGIQLMLVVNH